MMHTKTELVEALCEALSAETDPMLAGYGFARKKNSVEYQRPCEDGEQFLRMHCEFKPSYNPTADGRIYPYLRVVFPALNRLALEMVGHVALLIGDPSVTFSQPIDLAIPKRYHGRWYTIGRDSVLECVRSIKSSLERWVLRFLDEYRTVCSLTAAYEKHDERLEWQRHFYIYVAAAYVEMGQVMQAMQVLEERFGKAGLRRKYAKAFEYVAARIEKS
jgi:hypothetical protein